MAYLIKGVSSAESSSANRVYADLVFYDADYARYSLADSTKGIAMSPDAVVMEVTSVEAGLNMLLDLYDTNMAACDKDLFINMSVCDISQELYAKALQKRSKIDANVPHCMRG